MTLEGPLSAEAWAFLIGRGHGEGHIRCDNGQDADAVIKAQSVGLAVGQMKVDHGRGRFADLRDIDDVFGKYASTSAAAAGETAAAGALLKVGGEVKLFSE